MLAAHSHTHTAPCPHRSLGRKHSCALHTWCSGRSSCERAMPTSALMRATSSSMPLNFISGLSRKPAAASTLVKAVLPASLRQVHYGMLSLNPHGRPLSASHAQQDAPLEWPCAGRSLVRRRSTDVSACQQGMHGEPLPACKLQAPIAGMRWGRMNESRAAQERAEHLRKPLTRTRRWRP